MQEKNIKKLDHKQSRFIRFMNQIPDRVSELAAKVGLDPSTISNFRSGTVAPKMQTAILLEYIYGLNREWLLEGKDPMFLKKEKSNINLDDAIRDLIDIKFEERESKIEDTLTSLENLVKRQQKEIEDLKKKIEKNLDKTLIKPSLIPKN